MGDTLSFWIEQELVERGWSAREFGRRIGVSHTHAARIVNGEVIPSLKLCNEIGRVLDVTPEEVLRRAGLLPEIPGEELTFRQILDIVKRMTVAERRDVLAYILFRYRQDRKREADEKKKNSQET